MSGITYIGVMLLVLIAFYALILKPFGGEDRDTE